MTTETITEPITVTETLCTACEGTGSWDLFDDVPCASCNGTGFGKFFNWEDGFFQGTD